MNFKAKFYLVFFMVVAVSVYTIDQLLGKLYVRYMILFSSALFLIGMQYGQRSERVFREKIEKVMNEKKDSK
ncbi:MAG TPA: hypothetical protein VN944_04815 [Nitrospiria bacterium]|nr:hypothetical protein [Nitrospiria bacterium]